VVITIKKNSPPTKENVKKLHAEVTSLIPGHVNSLKPWTFYEEIDQFLGPWGASGYPLAYGKYYCKIFNEDALLQADVDARLWVWRTTVLLQEALRDYIDTAFVNGWLPSLSEEKFRTAAFASHARAYHRGGLSSVFAAAPYLIPLIAAIPQKEFVPFYSDNFWATVKQALDTMLRVGADVGAAAFGPAHTGMFQIANQQSGMNKLLAIQRRNNQYEFLFAQLLGPLRSGRLDRIAWLDQISTKLESTEFDDAYWLNMAKTTMVEVAVRKTVVVAKYTVMLQGHPELRMQLQRYDPSWTGAGDG
jgi:hypothetical protein